MRVSIISAVTLVAINSSIFTLRTGEALDANTGVVSTAPSSTIDNTDVPFSVINDIQMKYQSYAVTHVTKLDNNGQPIYYLTVDNDDIDYNGTSLYLKYDANWQFLGEIRYLPIRQRYTQYSPGTNNTNTTPRTNKPSKRHE